MVNKKCETPRAPRAELEAKCAKLAIGAAKEGEVEDDNGAESSNE